MLLFVSIPIFFSFFIKWAILVLLLVFIVNFVLLKNNVNQSFYQKILKQVKKIQKTQNKKWKTKRKTTNTEKQIQQHEANNLTNFQIIFWLWLFMGFSCLLFFLFFSLLGDLILFRTSSSSASLTRWCTDGKYKQKKEKWKQIHYINYTK